MCRYVCVYICIYNTCLNVRDLAHRDGGAELPGGPAAQGVPARI